MKNQSKEKFYVLLDQLKEAGLNLCGVHNSDLNSLKKSSPMAAKYHAWIEATYGVNEDRYYILGNVPASVENIENTVYVTLFEEIEKAFNVKYPVPVHLQKKLHEIVGDYKKGDKAKNTLKAIKKTCGKQYTDVWHLTQEKYHDYMQDITNELTDMLHDVLTLDNQLALNTTFEAFKMGMAWNTLDFTHTQLISIYNGVNTDYSTFKELDDTNGIIEFDYTYTSDVSLSACIDFLKDLESSDIVTTVLTSHYGYNGTSGTIHYLKEDGVYCLVLH